MKIPIVSILGNKGWRMKIGGENWEVARQAATYVGYIAAYSSPIKLVYLSITLAPSSEFSTASDLRIAVIGWLI